jgi:soluble lytic murein transglycosylase-like protein
MSILNRFTAPLKAASVALGVPVKLIVAVIIKESSGNPNVPGKSGEYGLMQLMPGTARGQGKYTGPLANLWDPATNIMVGTTVLADCLKREGSNLFNALRAYNGGPGWRTASLKGQAATLVYATQVSAIYNGM